MIKHFKKWKRKLGKKFLTLGYYLLRLIKKLTTGALFVPAVPLPANGEVRVRWNAVRHRKSYLLYKTTNLVDPLDASHWSLVNSVSQRNIVVDGLTSATRYAFIVVAVGAHNSMSQPSDPAIAMVA